MHWTADLGERRRGDRPPGRRLGAADARSGVGALLATAGIMHAPGSLASTPQSPSAMAAPAANLTAVASSIYAGGLNVRVVISVTGTKWFTVAFILSNRGRTPVW